MQYLNTKSLAGQQTYSVAHRPRVTKRLHLELDKSGGLVVVAPRHWSRTQINAALCLNKPRVERFLINARQRMIKSLQYTAGELHLYLGRRYPLVSWHESGKKTQVELVNDELRIKTARFESKATRVALMVWYRRQAQQTFAQRLHIIAAKTPWIQASPTSLKVRSMKRTWGNCSSKGVIKLNTHLVKAPLTLIDSVIAHELCHLQEMNHGKAFYHLLEGLNANWRQDRARLRAEGYIYLH